MLVRGLNILNLCRDYIYRYAYSMAGAHEELPHLRMDNYMVSNVDISQGEGWQWVDELFRSREIGFQKRRLKKDIFSCEQDLLLEPPKDLGFATYMIRNGNVS